MTPKQLILLIVLLPLLSVLVVAQDTKQKLNDDFWEAVRAGDVALVTTLLDKGADVNAKFRYGTTALFKAAERGHTEVVKLLLARGADVTVKDTFYGATAMTWALDNDHVEVVKALLEKDGSSVNDVLMQGARGGKPPLVRIALEKGGASPQTMTSALAVAMNDKEKTEIAELLKTAGAKPPLELDAATLASYVGKYKPEQGAEITVAIQEGRLFATPTGQRPIRLMALDKTTFKPVEFDGITVSFIVEGDKVNSFSLKQGPTTTVFKRAEDTKQP
jgi:ankyrin repeat protein